MTRWLPRICLSEWLGCDARGEAEGVAIVIEWGSLHIESVVAWRRP